MPHLDVLKNTAKCSKKGMKRDNQESVSGTKKHRSIRSGGALSIPLRIFGLTQQIVNGNVVKIGEFDQYIRGNVPLAHLIVAVDPLGTVEIFRQLPLLQVVIFPQITDSLVHKITHD